ncbi:RHOMBOID-like protein 9, chloroplastic isoform X1 [Rhodamnia argentea]|uniref:RHOMBOID-like protein 9, chloroplastic isoform X1 n=1 Tax=Rhodamnia argentea TaxID=178133 RepID=A0A8B8PPM0_9MYRT|nr:RHOMBOID-like protein 9, chloroplastic isoform X1 [Rhodamnia argentea]
MPPPSPALNRYHLDMVNMAVTPIRYKIPYIGRPHLSRNIPRHREGLFVCDPGSTVHGLRWFSSGSVDIGRRWSLQNEKMVGAPFLRRDSWADGHLKRLVKNAPHRKSAHVTCHASNDSSESQLRALDSYFGKLGDVDKPVLDDDSSVKIEVLGKSDLFKSERGLDLRDAYLGKAEGGKGMSDTNSGACSSSSSQDKVTARSDLMETPFPPSEESKIVHWRKTRARNEPRLMRDEKGQDSQVLQNFDDISDLYLISIIASINIAVFLFELARPVRNSDMDLFSLPLLYGAKINHLILTGEWWRLVTPMFLHSGVFHIALGCWALLAFGPKVCKGYGSFTFFLTYLLGGISGNLTSFLHTPDPTVGGTVSINYIPFSVSTFMELRSQTQIQQHFQLTGTTADFGYDISLQGPIFAMIGAWLIYQTQNKEMISKDVSESMFQKAVVATALSFLLSNFGHIDDWTHLGAAVMGIVYGYFTCPTLQLDDASSTSGQEEGITLVRQPADPRKSLLVFVLLILALGSLVYFIEPPLGTLMTDNLV